MTPEEVRQKAIEAFVKRIFTEVDFSNVQPPVVDLILDDFIIPKEQHPNYPNPIRKRMLRPIK